MLQLQLLRWQICLAGSGEIIRCIPYMAFALAAAFLGMTAFKEGVPNIRATFVGAAIIGILANGLTILEVPTFMQDVITGIIVIAAVIMQRLGRDNR